MGAVDVAAVAAFERLARFAAGVEGMGLSCAIRQREDGEREWLIALEWGREAPDSPMTGAAAYGTGESVAEAIHQALDDTSTPRVPDGDRAAVLYEAYRAAREGLVGRPTVVWTELSPDARQVWELVAAVHVGVGPMGPLARTAVGSYLDGAIRQWRQRLAEAKEPGPADGDAAARHVLIAECYIDAFQSVRSSLLGATLPADGGERDRGTLSALEAAVAHGGTEASTAPDAGRGELPHDTAGLVVYYVQETGLPARLLEHAVAPAIDAIYTGRDSGRTMHQSGALAAVAVLESIRPLIESPVTAWEGRTAKQWAERAKAAEKALLEHRGTIRRQQDDLDAGDQVGGYLIVALGVLAAPYAARAAWWAWRRYR